MAIFWKWIQRVVWLIAILSYLKGWVDMDAIKLFWAELSPWKLIFVLSVLIILYEIANFLFNLKKQVKNIQGLPREVENFEEQLKKLQAEPPNRIEADGRLGDRINKLEVNISELSKWIGRFSYRDDKGSYIDLRGKIKRYIQEELEKESTNQKDETKKYKALEKLEGLDYEEAFGKLTPDERERYLQHKDKE